MDDTKQGTDSSSGYERSDLSPKAIAMFGGGLAGVIAVVLIVVYLLFDFMAVSRVKKETPPSPLATRQTPPPEPRLQVDPAQDLEEMRRNEDNLLHGYGWVNREAEIVRIPVDRAMELLVQRGLPTRTGRAGTKVAED